jgi:hypothetical protein
MECKSEPTARIRFFEELNDFVPPDRRKVWSTVRVPCSPAVKDVIQSRGVPHTEVDLVVVNGESVDFSYRVKPDDRIAVYPVFESLDISSLARLRPRPLRRPRFICDVHLGKLARNLRLLGIDTAYENDYEDAVIVDVSRRERRAVLTRDRGLLMRSGVVRGYCVRSTDPRVRTAEVIERFDLADSLSPLTRCSRCNGPIADVRVEDVWDEVPPRTREHCRRFGTCRTCGRVYWHGSHVRSILEMAGLASPENKSKQYPS